MSSKIETSLEDRTTTTPTAQVSGASDQQVRPGSKVDWDEEALRKYVRLRILALRDELSDDELLDQVRHDVEEEFHIREDQ